MQMQAAFLLVVRDWNITRYIDGTLQDMPLWIILSRVSIARARFRCLLRDPEEV